MTQWKVTAETTNFTIKSPAGKLRRNRNQFQTMARFYEKVVGRFSFGVCAPSIRDSKLFDERENDGINRWGRLGDTSNHQRQQRQCRPSLVVHIAVAGEGGK